MELSQKRKKWEELAEEIRDKAHYRDTPTWFRLPDGYIVNDKNRRGVYRNHIRKGKLAAFRPIGAWECKNENGHLWIMYVGLEESKP